MLYITSKVPYILLQFQLESVIGKRADRAANMAHTVPYSYVFRDEVSGFILLPSDRSCVRGMIHNKIHRIRPGCPRPSIALQCRVVS